LALENARGFWENTVPWLMRGYLADAFEAYCGDHALGHARLLATWTDRAVKTLEARARASETSDGI
jgi:hypothetical protein